MLRTRTLQIVQVDNTKTDVFVVDGEKRHVKHNHRIVTPSCETVRRRWHLADLVPRRRSFLQSRLSDRKPVCLISRLGRGRENQRPN